MDAVVGLVGDGPEDDEGQGVAVGRLSDGRTLHLGTQALGDGDDAFLCLRAGDKLVAAGHPSDLRVARILRLGGGKGIADQRIVRREGGHVHLGHLAHGITKGGGVHIVIHGVLADHQVADVQLGAQRAGNAGIHQMGHTEQVAQDLRAQGRVDLADAALHHGNRQPLQQPLVKDAPGDFLFCLVSHQAQQGFNFLLHSADDSQFCHVFLLNFGRSLTDLVF